MENRPSHAQLTSNTLYTPQTIHLLGIAISGALKAALCQFASTLQNTFKKISSLDKCSLSLTANSNMAVKVTHSLVPVYIEHPFIDLPGFPCWTQDPVLPTGETPHRQYHYNTHTHVLVLAHVCVSPSYSGPQRITRL